MMENEPQLLVFDFDGCLYPYPTNFVETFIRAFDNIGAQLSNGEMNVETAGSKLMESFRRTGFGFYETCLAYNKSLHEGHIIHHSNLHFDLEPDPVLIGALEALDDQIVVPIILTHASHCFLDRKLKMLGLDHIFPRNMRVAMEDYGFHRGIIASNGKPVIEGKNVSLYPFLLAKHRAEAVTGRIFAPQNIWMLEDSPKNLNIPKTMGWNTVLTTHGKSQLKPPFVNLMFDTPAQFLDIMPKRLLSRHLGYEQVGENMSAIDVIHEEIGRSGIPFESIADHMAEEFNIRVSETDIHVLSSEHRLAVHKYLEDRLAPEY